MFSYSEYAQSHYYDVVLLLFLLLFHYWILLIYSPLTVLIMSKYNVLKKGVLYSEEWKRRTVLKVG